MRTWRFPSKSNGPGHNVVLGVYGLECDCAAGQHGRTCWAMHRAQADLDVEAIKRSWVQQSNLPAFKKLQEEAWAYLETQKFLRELQMGLTSILEPL